MSVIVATKPEVIDCRNPRHEEEDGVAVRAIACVSWPDGRFKPTTACGYCLSELVDRTVSGDEDDRRPVLITPIDQMATGSSASGRS